MRWAGIRSEDPNTIEEDVAVGLRSGVVELWSAEDRTLTAQFDALAVSASTATAVAALSGPIDPSVRAPKTMNAGSKLVGLDVLQSGMASVTTGGGQDRRLFTCSNEGVVHVRPWRTLTLDGDEAMEDSPPPPVKATKGKKGEVTSAAAAALPNGGSSEFAIGNEVCVVKVEPTSQSTFACGGKEHMLKVWDLAKQEVLFKEKNVRHDMLNLRQEVWINDIAWVPQSNAQQLVTGTAWHQVRHYDMRVQKRPLFNVEVGDHAVTCVDVSHDGRYLLVGDGSGRMQQLDLRFNARMVHVYKGMGGSVRGCQTHPTEGLLATCGLDRFLRVYDTTTRKQLHKVYLKQKLNCVLFSHQKKGDDVDREEEPQDEESQKVKQEDDELWQELAARSKRHAAAEAKTTTGAANASNGQYVKKRKAVDGAEDDEGAGETASKKTKVKQEPGVDASATASVAVGVRTPAAFKKIAPQKVDSQPQQIVFRQTVNFDEEEEDDEDAEGEDNDEDGEDADEDGEDGEDADMGDDGDANEDDDADGDDGEEDDVVPEPEPEPEPEPIPVTPAKKSRASRAPAPTPVSTRATRSSSKRG